MSHRFLVLPALAVLLGALAPGFAQAPATSPLFLPAQSDRATPSERPVWRRGVSRARVAREATDAMAAEALELNLFPDLVLHAERTARWVDAGNRIVWTGMIVGDRLSSVTFVKAGGMLQGSVRTRDRAYTIEPVGARGFSVVREVRLDALGPELPPLVPSGAQQVRALDDPAASLVDDGSTIDVLVAYTASARAAAGGTDDAIQARIVLGIAETNQAYSHSLVAQRLRLVGSELVGYHETGDIAFDLQRLTDRFDGQLDEVHTRRDAVGADLVQLIVGPESANACGVAWLMQAVSTNFAPLAFSVSEYDCISPNYTFGHELGHNMGSAHAPEDPNATPAFPYSYGYKHPGALFRTVMAYDCLTGCPRVLRFSNPMVTYGGVPTGSAGLQDNARSLNETAPFVANFRVSRDPLTVLGAPQNFSITTTGTTAQFSWSPPLTGSPTSYMLEAGSEEGFSNIATFVVQAPATAIVVPAVPPGRYFVRVRAMDPAGPGAPSASLELTMTTAGRCVAPPGPPLLATPIVSGQHVTLTWSPATTGGAVDAYVIGAGYSSESLDAAFIGTGSVATSAMLTAADGLYFVRVGGLNACGVGAPSNEVTLTVGPAIPGPPSHLTAALSPGGIVTLTWDASTAGAPPSAYVIEAGSAPGLHDIATLAGNGVSTAFATEPQPGLYYVRVRATNAEGLSAPSNEIVVFVP